MLIGEKKNKQLLDIKRKEVEDITITLYKLRKKVIFFDLIIRREGEKTREKIYLNKIKVIIEH